MFYAVKANRQYKIAEDEKQKYRDMGYKIAELKDDKLVFEETEETEETGEVEELIKERTVLKGQLTKANNRISELEKELEEVLKTDKKEEKKTKGEGK